MAQENPVEIQFENLLFVQGPFYLDRQQDFIELAHESALQAEEVVPCNLHGQGAAAGAFLPGQNQFGHRPQQAADVNPGVAEKAGILGSQQRLYKLWWYLLEAQGAAFLLAKLPDKFAVMGVNTHGRLQFDIAQGGHVGKVRAEI